MFREDKFLKDLRARHKAVRTPVLKEEVNLEEGKKLPTISRPADKNGPAANNWPGVPDHIYGQAKINAHKMAKRKGKEWNELTAGEAEDYMDQAINKLGYTMTVAGKYVKEEVRLEEATVYVKKRYNSLGANQFSNQVGFAKKINNAAQKLGLTVKMEGENLVISGDPEKIASMKKTVKGVEFSMKEDLDEEFIDLEEAVAELEEGKSSSGYELYHDTFSSAMKTAYDFAKSKYGITVDPEEIDSKVASGPKKPSAGKTNSYSLKGDRGTIQVQVYNMDNKKYELNVYKS